MERVLLAGVALALAVAAAPAAAQTARRYEVDPSRSLAWWQVDPNFGHLWATTCPREPTWQPGEGRSEGARINMKTRKKTTAAARSDKRVPLYPRDGEVTPVCRTAVRGELNAENTESWQGLRGVVVVLADSLVTGLDMRDAFARGSVLHTKEYPELRFTLDSLSGVVPGDTIRATAHGNFMLHGVRQPLTAPVRAWPEAGALRALAQFTIEAKDLTHVYGMSKKALGMGVVMGSWDRIHVGVDLILQEAVAR